MIILFAMAILKMYLYPEPLRENTWVLDIHSNSKYTTGSHLFCSKMKNRVFNVHFLQMNKMVTAFQIGFRVRFVFNKLSIDIEQTK